MIVGFMAGLIVGLALAVAALAVMARLTLGKPST